MYYFQILDYYIPLKKAHKFLHVVEVKMFLLKINLVIGL